MNYMQTDDDSVSERFRALCRLNSVITVVLDLFLDGLFNDPKR